MPALPNPFDNSEPAAALPNAAETAAAAAPTIAAADSLDRFDNRFVLDERAFLEALEEPPLFLRPGFMR